MLPQLLLELEGAQGRAENVGGRQTTQGQRSLPRSWHVRGTIKLVAGQGHISTYRSLSIADVAWVLANSVTPRRTRGVHHTKVLVLSLPRPKALEAAESSDGRAASRSRSPRAPRGRGPSQMWLNALYAAQREIAEEGIQPRGRVRRRAQEIMEQWRKENQQRKLMESKESDSD